MKDIMLSRLNPTLWITATVAGLVMAASPLPAKSPMRGPLPAEQREHIHEMADLHQEFTRTVQLTETGYTATTLSGREDLVERLHEHIRYMLARLDSGAMVRRWDPAFAELVDYYDQLETHVEVLPRGVRVEVIGKTPEAVQVAQNHAKIVTGFTREGRAAVQRRHEPALNAGLKESP